jgi:uncharacterized protein
MRDPERATSAKTRQSRYNFISEIEDGVRLAFNAATAALVEIEPESYPVIARILEDPASVTSDEEKQLRDQLIEGGYLVRREKDELAELQVESRRHRTQNPVFFLTIAPTLACNFDCDYCFQSHESGRMSRETEAAVIAFSEERIRRSEEVLLTWFGGEPTLCMPTIERLQEALGDLATRHGAEMNPASIVTNGYLLDGKMASRLAASGIEAAQVTLDGPERLHDRRRKLRGGQGTFRTIVKNLAESAEILRIVVRVNVDRDNMDASTEIIGVLDDAGVLPHVQVYFAPVNETQNVCADMKGRCFTTDEFAQRQLALYRKLVDVGFKQIDYPEPASGGYCGADTENGYVVAPNGLLFKCWEELSLDGKRSVGSLFSKEREPHQQANLGRYRSWQPLGKPRCKRCDILPLCMGGCPLQGLRIDDRERGFCSPWKFNLPEMLHLRYVCNQ